MLPIEYGLSISIIYTYVNWLLTCSTNRSEVKQGGRTIDIYIFLRQQVRNHGFTTNFRTYKAGFENKFLLLVNVKDGLEPALLIYVNYILYCYCIRCEYEFCRFITFSFKIFSFKKIYILSGKFLLCVGTY